MQKTHAGAAGVWGAGEQRRAGVVRDGHLRAWTGTRRGRAVPVHWRHSMGDGPCAAGRYRAPPGEPNPPGTVASLPTRAPAPGPPPAGGGAPWVPAVVRHGRPMQRQGADHRRGAILIHWGQAVAVDTAVSTRDVGGRVGSHTSREPWSPRGQGTSKPWPRQSGLMQWSAGEECVRMSEPKCSPVR